MDNTIKFEGFKFKNSFNFKNAKARGNYFNDLLFNNIDRFREKQKEYFSEKLHVLFTYLMLFKIFAYTDLVLALFLPSARIALVIIAVILFVIHLILNKKFKINMFRYEFTIFMHKNDDFIEFLRKENIKFDKLNYKK